MIEFYISKKDIKKAMPSASNYLINKHWANVREYCDKRGIVLFDRSTVPTDAFCKYMKIDKELLLMKMREEWAYEKKNSQ